MIDAMGNDREQLDTQALSLTNRPGVGGPDGGRPARPPVDGRAVRAVDAHGPCAGPDVTPARTAAPGSVDSESLRLVSRLGQDLIRVIATSMT